MTTMTRNRHVTTYGSGSALTAAGLCPSLVQWSGTLSRIVSGTGLSVQTVTHVYIKCMCLLDTNAPSALEVLHDNCAI